MDNLNKELEFKIVFTSTEIDIKGMTFLSILGNVLTVYVHVLKFALYQQPK